MLSSVTIKETARTLPLRRSKAPTCCPCTAKGNKAKYCHLMCLPEQSFPASLPLHPAVVPTRLLPPCPLPLGPCPHLHLCEIGSWCGGTVETEMLITLKRVTGAVNEKWHREGGAMNVTQEVQSWKGESKKVIWTVWEILLAGGMPPSFLLSLFEKQEQQHVKLQKALEKEGLWHSHIRSSTSVGQVLKDTLVFLCC